MLPFGGAVTVSVPLPFVKDIPTMRCSISNACVGAPGRISTTDEMLAASGVVTVNDVLHEIGRRNTGDGRPCGQRATRVEQIGGLINLQVLLVRTASRISAGERDRRVRAEGARSSGRGARKHSAPAEENDLPMGSYKSAFRLCGAGVLILGRAAHCQNLAAGQDDRVHFGAPLAHAGARRHAGVAAPMSMISVVATADWCRFDRPESSPADRSCWPESTAAGPRSHRSWFRCRWWSPPSSRCARIGSNSMEVVPDPE